MTGRLKPRAIDPTGGVDGDTLVIVNGEFTLGSAGSGGGGSVETPLGGLSDVTVTNPATGNVIRWSGAEWANATLAIADVSGLQAALDGKAASGHTHPVEAHTHEGYAAAQHTHPLGDLQATGTPDGTTFLRGDGTWAVPAGGGVGGSALPPGGTTGQVLKKASDTDGDVVWGEDLQGTGSGGGSLNDLTDVDTTTVAPTGGQALVYNAATSTWEPGTISGGGGVEVGTWETVSVAFTVPDPIEVDLRPQALTLPDTKPAAPQVSRTVVEADLVTSSRPDVDIATAMFLYVYGRHVSAAPSTISWELTLNGALLSSGSDSGHALNEHWAVTGAWHDVAVGDVLEVYVWANVSGSEVYGSAVKSFSNHMGRADAPNGGRWLYRDLTITGFGAAYTPAIPGDIQFGGSTDDYNFRDLSLVQAVDAPVDLVPRTWLPDETTGLFQAGYVLGGAFSAGIDSSYAYLYRPDVSPASLTVKRIEIPKIAAT